MKIPSFLIKSSKEIFSSKSGLILFGEMCHKIGLPNLINKTLPIAGSNRGFEQDCFVIPLLLMLHIGGRNLEDINVIKNDQGLCTLMNLRDIPQAGTIGDWLRRMGATSGIDDLGKVNKHIFQLSLQSLNTDHLTLDIDATVIKSHKYEAKYTYKGYKGFTPMLGHVAENGAVVYEEFRAGNIAPAADNLGFIKKCIKQLPSNKSFTKLRADAASYQKNILEHCQANNMDYAIGGKMSANLKSTINLYEDDDWKPYYERDGVKTDSEILAIPWNMENSKHKFTMIVQRTLVKAPDLFDGKYHYHLVATNIKSNAQEILHWYCQRGECSENRIKELKIGFAQEHMPCGTEEANAVFFRLGVMAYNLFILFKRDILGADWLKTQIQTIRLHIYHLPSKIIKASRKLIMKVSNTAYKLLSEIRQRLISFAGTT